MIQRAVTPRILKNLSVFPAANIIGPRQVGKTTLARYLQTRIEKETLYLDLQNEQDFDKLAAPTLFLREHTDACVIIDEIQRLPSLYSHLRSIIDEKREAGRFILLGSASPAIIKGVSESLAGRVFFTELTPFSLPELKGVAEQKIHWLRGGFPDAVGMPDEDLASEWYEHFIRAFVERDLPELGYRLSPQLFGRFLRMLSIQQGQLLNLSGLSGSLDVNTATLGRYLDLLEGAFLVRRLQPWHSNAGKRLVKSPKTYIRDSGLLHHLLRIRTYDDLLGHPSLGNSWEGYVIEEAVRATQGKWEYYFYRTQHGAEADLVMLDPSGEMYCVEIKFAAAPALSRGFYQSIADLNPSRKYVVIPYGESYPKSEGIRVLNLADFLSALSGG